MGSLRLLWTLAGIFGGPLQAQDLALPLNSTVESEMLCSGRFAQVVPLRVSTRLPSGTQLKEQLNPEVPEDLRTHQIRERSLEYEGQKYDLRSVYVEYPQHPNTWRMQFTCDLAQAEKCRARCQTQNFIQEGPWLNSRWGQLPAMAQVKCGSQGGIITSLGQQTLEIKAEFVQYASALAAQKALTGEISLKKALEIRDSSEEGPGFWPEELPFDEEVLEFKFDCKAVPSSTPAPKPPETKFPLKKPRI